MATRGLDLTTREQARALESPVRQEIVDAVAAGGACTVAEIGAWLDRRPDTLYYHVAALVRAGIMVEAGRVRTGRRFGRIYDVAGRPVRLARGKGRGGIGGAEMARVLNAGVRLGARDLAKALRTGVAATEGAGRNLWGGRVRGWLGARDAARAGQLIEELAGILRAGRPGAAGDVMPFSFTYVLTPVAVKPPRGGAGRKKSGPRGVPRARRKDR
jgi:hypothetical protein